MGKKILDSKITYIILAVLCSILFWFYVKTTQEDNMVTKTIEGIPVTFEGTEDLESRGLMVLPGDTVVDITIEVRRNAVLDFNRDTIQLTVDVSGITETGSYVMGYDIKWPSGVSYGDYTLQGRSAINVPFDVVKYSEKDVPIQGSFVGSLADGYLQGDFSFEPSTVHISGQARLVDLVDYALVTISGEDVSSTITGERAFTFIGYDGSELTDLDVECAEETVNTTMPVLLTKEVELKVEWNDGGGLTASDITWEISPRTIMVGGEPADIQALQEIVLGPVDLATVTGSTTLNLEIPLANELTNISGITEAAVTVTIGERMTTTTVETTDIEVINPPDGYTARSLTTALSVVVRGTAEELANITPANVRVVADLTGSSAATGQYSVPVRVYVDSAGNAGAVGTDYRIVVSMRRS